MCQYHFHLNIFPISRGAHCLSTKACSKFNVHPSSVAVILVLFHPLLRRMECSEPSQLSVKPGQTWSNLVKPCRVPNPSDFWALDSGPWTPARDLSELDFRLRTLGLALRTPGAYRHSTAPNGAPIRG